MKIPFTKYQGTGNDFVLIDNRQDFFPKNDISLISAIAKSKFGVGADGVILLENFKEGDFSMIYYNADGSQSLCGNGSRCAVQFAKDLSIIEDRAIFQTFDGIHDAFIRNGMIYFSLLDVNKIDVRGTHYFMNNGSPHYVEFVNNVDNVDTVEKNVDDAQNNVNPVDSVDNVDNVVNALDNVNAKMWILLKMMIMWTARWNMWRILLAMWIMIIMLTMLLIMWKIMSIVK